MIVRKSAWLSPCKKHRYSLTRVWDASLPAFVVIGLNPSTADENTDDPTIRRCIGFAKREGCGALIMLNLFSFRATKPEVLRGVEWSELTDFTKNVDVVKKIVSAHESTGIICVAWGSGGDLLGASDFYKHHLPKVVCLGHTKSGQPRHPLYVPADKSLEPWQPWRVA